MEPRHLILAKFIVFGAVGSGLFGIAAALWTENILWLWFLLPCIIFAGG